MRRIPSWGTVSALPHEHLIHLRNGRVLHTAQGGSCFKWPSDTVALVDTSVHRLQFVADQITREKIGVQVTGLAVFRIVRPTLAYRMLDLSDPDAYGCILREMFVGATRRLVANLSLEECITRRKDALATELMREVAPVVEGSGAVDDTTEQGWGMAIDTIEVQDVRVLSADVFESLQAPYREELALAALQAEEEVQKEKARQHYQMARQTEERRREMMGLEEERLRAERERFQANLEHEAVMERLKQEAELKRAAERLAAEARHLELEQEALLRREQAKVEAEQKTLDHKNTADLKRLESRAQSAAAIAQLKAQAERVKGEAHAEVTRLQRTALDQISEARLQELLVTQTLPEVARAFRGSFEKAVVVGGGAGGMDFLGQGIAQVVTTLQTLGLGLPSAALADAD